MTRRDLANQLREVLDGTLDSASLQDRLGRTNLPTELSAIVINLNHYFDDSDIRLKDTQYKEMQNAELGKLIAILLSDDPLDRATDINFLHESS